LTIQIENRANEQSTQIL